MGFIELDRNFISLQADQEYRAEVLEGISLRAWQGDKWPHLLEQQRVIVLAEAASGKSEEFRQKSLAIRQNRGFAIYLPIERLEKNGLVGSLSKDDKEAFEKWQYGDTPGWFFLDSIDEARIHQKDIEHALNCFRDELGDTYERARILLSCRGTVWTGEKDLALINLTLPIRTRAEADDITPADSDTALLERLENTTSAPKSTQDQEPKIQLFALAKITRSQRTAFLTAEKITDIDEFEDALFKRGLEPLAERPGDLKTLVSYWKNHRSFGDLTEMLEFGISERLKEINNNRRDIIGISEDDARRGVERLAAAMTLSQNMDLVLPEIYEGDEGGINPHQVLSDWKPRDVDGLLQRGIFVPASFGRLRFYHRSAQEYLTASWFKKLMPALSDPELYRIFLANVFDIETIPPSLRAAAAWLAQSHHSLREQIIIREPHILLSEGDPRKLSIEDRSRLLNKLAEKQLAGDSTHRLIDHQALWMFADEKLVPAIRSALAVNDRSDFRFEMLRLIQQGKLSSCQDIVLETALKRQAGSYHRIVAIDTLALAKDKDSLQVIADNILKDPIPLPANFAPSVATALFPSSLTVAELLQIIGSSKPPRQYQIEGFNKELVLLYEQCTSDSDRKELIAGLAKLALEPPLDDWPPISKRNAILASRLAPIARTAVAQSDGEEISEELLALLAAATNARDEDREARPSLSEMVADRPELNQALFWKDADVAEAQIGKPVTKYRSIRPHGPPLWQIDADKKDWLIGALQAPNPNHRLLALDVLIVLAFHDDDTIAELAKLREYVADEPPLLAAVEDAQKPQPETAEDKKWRKKMAVSEKKNELREKERREYWLSFRDKIQTNTEQLYNRKKLSRWPGPHPLLQMTRWLTKRSGNGFSDAALNWRALETAFGQDAAAAYRSGMKLLWRVTNPERPREKPDGQRTVKYTIILSMAGLAIEAAEGSEWAKNLNPAEAKRATQHVCMDDQTIPEWLGALLQAHPTIVAPLVAAEISREWRSSSPHTPFLDRAANSLPIGSLQGGLLKLLNGPPSKSVARVTTASDLVLRLKLNETERRKLAKLVFRRFRTALKSDDTEMTGAQLRLLFRLAPEQAATEFITLLNKDNDTESSAGGPNLLRSFFDRHHGSVIDPAVLGPLLLGQLLELAYNFRLSASDQRISNDNDEEPQDRYIDDPLNELLSAMLRLDGEEAYDTMIALSQNSIVGDSGHRLRELAREIAERSAEREPWTEPMTQKFEADTLAPISNGEDLFNLTLALLEEINWSFANADMSARSVVETAKDEAAVQNWLGSTLANMSKGRFLPHRETHVADEKRPDLLITASSAPVEVAIEIKHDDKGWSLKDLRSALRVQLAEQYLQPENRRYGVLVISNHRDGKFWRDMEEKVRLSFDKTISLLQREAKEIRHNSSGSISVSVCGIDAAPRIRTSQKNKSTSP
ncbi:hypothetical protein [Parasphingorhabdus sp.]|uniref:hypothetical protein n=1 Tax=Parasphingorhabdus sp. TaxID=2709688 RepID=UPI003D26E66F